MGREQIKLAVENSLAFVLLLPSKSHRHLKEKLIMMRKYGKRMFD